MQDMLQDHDANLVLSLADDKLMLGHVQSDWTGLGPILEDDIAASSMAQDDMSHALVLYEYLGSRFDLDPDVIAFEREPAEYRCCDMVTMPDEFDWAFSLVRRWLLSLLAAPILDRLGNSGDEALDERCRKLQAEQAVHVDYLDDWMRRLGTGSSESHQRMQDAIDALAPHAGMLLEVPGRDLAEDEDFCRGREELFNEWLAAVKATLDSAKLTADITLPAVDCIGGRRGEHAEHFVAQLTEMNEVRCTDPGAAW